MVRIVYSSIHFWFGIPFLQVCSLSQSQACAHETKTSTHLPNRLLIVVFDKCAGTMAMVPQPLLFPIHHLGLLLLYQLKDEGLAEIPALLVNTLEDFFNLVVRETLDFRELWLNLQLSADICADFRKGSIGKLGCGFLIGKLGFLGLDRRDFCGRFLSFLHDMSGHCGHVHFHVLRWDSSGLVQ